VSPEQYPGIWEIIKGAKICAFCIFVKSSRLSIVIVLKATAKYEKHPYA